LRINWYWRKDDNYSLWLQVLHQVLPILVPMLHLHQV
jgi:hypothetical protein